ncbi:hypothetical protein ACI2L1_38380 [Streptomyces sp. NPDC019531]|uniref:hypothetical protein n=1 Tax=Streptomyces sp. NPDC019531 TaxID=3365062 RepID=UPI00384C52DA
MPPTTRGAEKVRLITEVGDDLQSAAERLHVGRKGGWTSANDWKVRVFLVDLRAK